MSHDGRALMGGSDTNAETPINALETRRWMMLSRIFNTAVSTELRAILLRYADLAVLSI